MFELNGANLNEEQIAAIKNDNNVFLVACPGSGKTRTITFKIAHELSKLTSNKQFIIAITYTNRAADEIHERIRDLGVNTAQLWIGTIHSFCLEWILKPYGIYHDFLKNGFRIIDQWEKDKLIEGLCVNYKKHKITSYDCDFYVTELDYILGCPDTGKHEIIHVILQNYFKALEDDRLLDYEFILKYAYELLSERPGICRNLGALFKHILIDEYQDTKRIQYLIITSIIKGGKAKTKAMVVGDPNQSIYTTLGGFAISFEDFKKMAKIDMDMMELSRNYRSSSRIIKYFSKFNIYDTKIKPASKISDYQSVITYNKVIDQDSLSEEISRIIKFNILQAGISPNEICILAPQWSYLASMTRCLVEAMPEYQFDGPGTVPFARDTENFWYKLSKIALTQASPDIYVKRIRWAGDILADLDLAGAPVDRITCRLLLRECNAIKIEEENGLEYLRIFFDKIFDRLAIDYKKYSTLSGHHKAFFESSAARIERLSKGGSEFVSDIAAFRQVFKEKRGIKLSTIHGVKGGEYDTVIAFALLKSLVPHFNDPNGKDTANKMLYVIASRARKNLHLFSETGRVNSANYEYAPTEILNEYKYVYDRPEFH